jgi:hypothetical protein
LPEKYTNVKCSSLFTWHIRGKEKSFITLTPGIKHTLSSILSKFKLARKIYRCQMLQLIHMAH